MKKFLALLILTLWSMQISAQVVISEIAWMGTVASSYDEWMEIFNTGVESVDLSGWTLAAEDGSPSLVLTGNIAPNKFHLFERTDDTATSLLAHQIYSGGLSNDGEVMFLKNNLGEIIDQTPLSLPWAAGNNTERRTMERTFPITNGSDENSWHTFSLDTSDVSDSGLNSILGSPGSESSPPPILPSFTGTVEILDLFPVQKNEETPWLRFSVLNTGLFDITSWKISNGTESQVFTDHLEKLSLLSGGTMTAPGRYLSDSSEIPIFFEWTGDLLPFSETGLFFVQDEKAATLSQKQINSPQILISEISIDHLLNDFIELFVKESPDDFNAKFLEIKHNGTRLFFAENTLKIQENDFLTLDLKSEKIQEEPVRYRNTTTLRETGNTYSWESSTKNGLNGSSGTMELNLFADTAWERSEDFLCWAKESLSETEQTRLLKNIPQNWQESCVNISESIENESIARQEPQTDGNTKADFIRHFNGSPGEENYPHNQPPIAKFYIQGSPTVTTSANLSALDEINPNNGTIDPDGKQDLKSFSWTINGKACGDFLVDGWEWRKTRNGESLCNTSHLEEMEWRNPNPDRIYFNFETKPVFSVALVVEDFGGEISEFSDTITKTTPLRHGGNGAFETSIKSWLEKEFSKTNTKDHSPKLKPDDLVEGFFEEFLLTISPEELIPISFQKKQIKSPNFYISKTRTAIFQRDKYAALQRNRMQKNIGLSWLDPNATAWGKLLDQTDPTES